jgi:hypothetical protein
LENTEIASGVFGELLMIKEDDTTESETILVENGFGKGVEEFVLQLRKWVQ